MKIYLARHGEYAIDVSKQLDVLSENGMKQISALATFLKPINLTISNIFHSEKNRAKQTAEILANGFQYANSPQARSDISPNSDVHVLTNEIQHGEEDILVVGHMPFMGKLVSLLLAGNDHHTIIEFHPGTLVCLERTHIHHWNIEWVLSPSLFFSTK